MVEILALPVFYRSIPNPKLISDISLRKSISKQVDIVERSRPNRATVELCRSGRDEIQIEFNASVDFIFCRQAHSEEPNVVE